MYEPNAAAQTLGLFFWLISAVLYFYFAFAQFKIAQKINHSAPWWAFIPVLNLFQEFQLAGKPWYWIFLYCIPLVNIIAWVVVWMDIAKKVGQSPVWGFLTLLPVINFAAIGVLAFSGGGSNQNSPFPQKEHQIPKQPEKVQ